MSVGLTGKEGTPVRTDTSINGQNDKVPPPPTVITFVYYGLGLSNYCPPLLDSTGNGQRSRFELKY